MTDIWLLYSTFPARKEALFAARQLLEKKLIACANIYDHVTSLYRWQGKLHEEAEIVLMAKTRQDKVQAAIDLMKQSHPSELPCIVAYPVAAGFPPFLQWVADEVSV